MHSMPMRPAARMWQPVKVMSWMLPFVDVDGDAVPGTRGDRAVGEGDVVAGLVEGEHGRACVTAGEGAVDVVHVVAAGGHGVGGEGLVLDGGRVGGSRIECDGQQGVTRRARAAMATMLRFIQNSVSLPLEGRRRPWGPRWRPSFLAVSRLSVRDLGASRAAGAAHPSPGSSDGATARRLRSKRASDPAVSRHAETTPSGRERPSATAVWDQRTKGVTARSSRTRSEMGR